MGMHGRLRRNLHIDGGAVNPLPYDLLFDSADVVVGIGVSLADVRGSAELLLPSMSGAAQFMQGAITEQARMKTFQGLNIAPGDTGNRRISS